MKRVVAFHEGHAIYNGSASEWNLWDWDTLTTVVTGAIVGGDDVNNWNEGSWCLTHYCYNISQALLCQAHKRGVRVVGFTYWPWNTSPQSWGQLTNATKRQLWVKGAVATAVRLGLDGYNVDIEGQMNASLRDSLTSLTCELRAALTAAIPAATVSFDLAVDPGAYPPIMLGYDYPGLARCLDTLAPMAYDMVDPVLGTMVHHANAPLPGVLSGIGKLAAVACSASCGWWVGGWVGGRVADSYVLRVLAHGMLNCRVVPTARYLAGQDRHVAAMVRLRLCLRYPAAGSGLCAPNWLPPQQPRAWPGS